MIERSGQTIFMRGACTVEDAETLLAQLHQGAAAIDVSGCTLLHTACLQVVAAAQIQLIGTPEGALLARWVMPSLPPLPET